MAENERGVEEDDLIRGSMSGAPSPREDTNRKISELMIALRASVQAAKAASEPAHERDESGLQRLMGFSFGSNGKKFHCLECIERAGDWRNRRAMALVEFPELQVYVDGTYNFVRGLRVVKAGPFGARLYAIDDDGVDPMIALRAESAARDNNVLLVPNVPIPIRPDYLVCAICKVPYLRELTADDLKALASAMADSFTKPFGIRERATIFGNWKSLWGSKPAPPRSRS